MKRCCSTAGQADQPVATVGERSSRQQHQRQETMGVRVWIPATAPPTRATAGSMAMISAAMVLLRRLRSGAS